MSKSATASEFAACFGCAAVLFAETLAFGGDRADTALWFVAANCVLAMLLLATRWGRRSARQLVEHVLPIALFLLALGFAFTSTWGVVPGHAIWRPLGLSLAGPLDRSAVAIELTKLAGLGAAFTVGLIIAGTDLRALLLLRTMIVLGALYGTWAFGQHIVEPGMTLGVVKSYHISRLTASFLSANIAGGFFGALLILTVALLVEQLQITPVTNARDAANAITRLGPPLTAAAILAVCLALTASRAAAFSSLAGVSLLLFWAWPGRRPGWRLGALLAAAALACLLVLLLFSSQRLLGRSGSIGADWNARGLLYTIHWRAFLSSPWFGFGLGSFQEINRLFADEKTFALVWNVRAAHNVYIQWLEQAGMLGAAPMFLCLALLLRRIFLGALARERMGLWLKAILAATALLLLHSFADFDLETPSIAAFWACLLGVGTALASRGSARAQQTPKPIIAERWAPWLLSTSLPVTGIVAALLWWELQPRSAPEPVPLPLSSAYSLNADSLLAGPHVSGTGQARAREFTAEELRLSPAEPSGWLRLVYLDAVNQPAAPRSAIWLERSYRVAPFDTASFKWRTSFAFEHWDTLTINARYLVLRDLRGERALFGSWIAELPNHVSNRAGRLALVLALRG